MCGTNSPVWLDKTSLSGGSNHKSKDYNNSEIIPTPGMMLFGHACVSWSFPGLDDCCLFTIPVTVVGCDGFLSYYLQPTQACNVAYCAVSEEGR